MTKKIYKGFIKEGDYGESYDAIFLIENKDKLPLDQEPLISEIQETIKEEGNFLSVRYFISEERKSIEELEENLIKKIFGATEARYEDAYSEYTGYLWTDQELNIGGHDFIIELRSNVGKFIYLEITYSKGR